MKWNFIGNKVLITGGLGFIGSNLAIALVNQGAMVTILDNLLPGLGGNIYNINSIKDKVTVNYGDIRDSLIVRQLVKDQDFVFHLARQTDHIVSQSDPYPDIDINIRGTAVLLEAVKKYNPNTKLVYIGTRGQYGKAVTVPVNEMAPTNPRGIYELTSLTAEKMIAIYNDVHKIRSVLLRLTNVYGPRGQMRHNRYGVVNWFIRVAMDGGVIQVFGDGGLRRDFLYIDDAVAAILLAATTTSCTGEVINVGRPEGNSFLELAKTIVEVTNSGSFAFAPFTPERAAQEPGDFWSDITKITTLTGWSPTVSLKTGIKETLKYYRLFKSYYW